MHATVSYFNVIFANFEDLCRMCQSCFDVLYFGACITCKEGKFDVDRHVCTLIGRGGRGGVCEGSMDFTPVLQGCCDFLQPGGCDHISGNLDFSRVLGLLAVSRVTCDVQLGRKASEKASVALPSELPENVVAACARVLGRGGCACAVGSLAAAHSARNPPSSIAFLPAKRERKTRMLPHAFSVFRHSISGFPKTARRKSSPEI